jgi:hypothetical protein
VIASVMLVAVPAVMMEEVHERAGEDEQVRQDPEHVGGVLGQQEEARNGQEAD